MTAAPDIDALLSRLSLEAKVAQLGTVRISSLLEGGSFSPEDATQVIPRGVGRVRRVGRESGLDPEPLARAIADVLLGADPGGRLPVSLPRSVGQLPVEYRSLVVEPGTVDLAIGRSATDY